MIFRPVLERIAEVAILMPLGRDRLPLRNTLARTMMCRHQLFYSWPVLPKSTVPCSKLNAHVQ